MLRQRLRTHSSPLARAGQLLVAVLALALVWYGLMLALLALKVSPASVNVAGLPAAVIHTGRSRWTGWG